MASLDSTDDLAAVAALDERQLVDGLQERFEADRICAFADD